MSARAYNLVVLGGVGALLVIAAWLALTQEPLSGDLTRVGALPERDFGWQDTKPRFAPELFRYRAKDDPIESAPVVVIGDSFSHQSDHGFGWQNFFVARTGLELLVYHLRGRPAEQVLLSPELRRNPPKLVIYEIAELNLPDYVPRYAGDCTLPPARAWEPLAVHPVPYRLAAYTRRTSWGWELKPRIEQAMHIVKVRAAALLGDAGVRQLKLTRTDLFSSREQSLLVYGYDVPADDWRSLDRAGMACGLRNLKTAVEQVLGTPLVVLYAPGKLSATAAYVADAPASYGGFIPALRERSGIPAPAVLERLREAVAAGIQDVYLPDDSHWANQGHAIAADALYDFLLARGLIRAADRPPDADPAPRPAVRLAPGPEHGLQSGGNGLLASPADPLGGPGDAPKSTHRAPAGPAPTADDRAHGGQLD